MLTQLRVSSLRLIKSPFIKHVSKKAYEGHIPLNFLEKSTVAVKAAFGALLDPTKQELVAALGETTSGPALKYMRDRMLQDREGRKILRERPIVNTSTIDMEYLSKLPKNTFGYNYWYFLDSNKIGPDGRTPVHYVDDEELAYVINRYRQVHDFFHTLFDLNISVQEEISVKWFEMVHFQLPMNTLSALFGPLRLTAQERAELLEKSVPWALTVGNQAKFLLSVPYEQLFEKDLNELREELNVIPHPK